MYVQAMFNNVEGVLAKMLKEREEDRARVDELYQLPLQLHQVTDRPSAVERNFVTNTACADELEKVARTADLALDTKLDQLRAELNKCLSTKRTARKPRGSTERRGKFSDVITISQRPAVVDDRAVPGHWESQWCCQAA